MKSSRFWITCALGLAIAGVASIAAAVVHPPNVNPANFGCGLTNARFPLTPGMTWTYRGMKEGVTTSNVTRVTSCTRVIEGVTTTLVRDQAYEGEPPGVLAEDTKDYYAVDCDGNVWYFGEETVELATGSTEGTWIAGENPPDADAGLIMLAMPQPGDRYYQEFAPGVAVDLAKVLTLSGSSSSPFTGPANNLLVTKETSQLDPGVVENKYYKSGVGFIRGQDVKGGMEFSELVSFSTGRPTCP